MKKKEKKIESKTKTGQVSVLREVIDKIKQDYHPEKIVLFGSYAQGDAHKDSDIDLLVIKDSSLRRDERDREIRELLRDIKIPLDIFVYTPREVEKFYSLEGSFINKIFNSGKVVYG